MKANRFVHISTEINFIRVVLNGRIRFQENHDSILLSVSMEWSSSTNCPYKIGDCFGNVNSVLQGHYAKYSRSRTCREIEPYNAKEPWITLNSSHNNIRRLQAIEPVAFMIPHHNIEHQKTMTFRWTHILFRKYWCGISMLTIPMNKWNNIFLFIHHENGKCLSLIYSVHQPGVLFELIRLIVS